MEGEVEGGGRTAGGRTLRWRGPTSESGVVRQDGGQWGAGEWDAVGGRGEDAVVLGGSVSPGPQDRTCGPGKIAPSPQGRRTARGLTLMTAGIH